MLQLAPDLQDEDFSHLSLRQADLRSASLVGVDLRNAELASARFADSFGIVSSVAVSPDGQFLAAGAGRTVAVWRLHTLQPYRFFEHHSRNVAEIAFAPDSNHLVSAGYDGSVFIWDMRAGGELANQFKMQAGDLSSIAFSPDGEKLAVGYSGLISVWNWQRSEPIATLTPKEQVIKVAFATNNELLVSTGYQGEIESWDVAAQRIMFTLRGGDVKRVTNAALVVANSVILTSSDEAINVRDRRSRTLIHTLNANKGLVRALAVSPHEDFLASAHADGTLTIWDLRIPRLVRILSGHQGEVRGLTFTPDSRYLVSGGYDETVRIWNTENGLEEKRLQGYLRWVNRLDFSPDGQYLAGTTLTGTVYLWRGHDLSALHILRGHKSAVRAVAFSPDSQLLVTGGDDSCVSLWDVQSGVRRHALHGHELFVRAVAFDRSGRYLASGSHDNSIRLWDVASGRLLRVISHASASIMHAMAFSPRDDLLAYGDANNRVHLCNIEMGEIETGEIETGEIVASAAVASQSSVLAFSPCGRRLACGAYDGSVTIWEVVSEDAGMNLVERHRFHPSTQCVWRLLFSPDGSLLAWNGETKEIHVASIADGEVLYHISDNHQTTCITFSADGQQLLTDGSRFEASVHDAATGETISKLVGHDANLIAIGASPVSSAMASSDATGVIKLWDLASGTVLATAKLNGPYLGMNITGATGLTQGQRQALLALGAVDTGGL